MAKKEKSKKIEHLPLWECRVGANRATLRANNFPVSLGRSPRKPEASKNKGTRDPMWFSVHEALQPTVFYPYRLAFARGHQLPHDPTRDEPPRQSLRSCGPGKVLTTPDIPRIRSVEPPSKRQCYGGGWPSERPRVAVWISCSTTRSI